MELSGHRLEGESINICCYKISKEKKMMGLFDLMLYAESLQFNDPRYIRQ